LALANLSQDYERDLEAKNAAIKRITEDFEKSLHSLSHRKTSLQESKNGEINKLNYKAKEVSNRSKIWASYKDILTTLDLGKEL
jgi:dsDNA-specific endonuclease/ATPase MutS2